MKRIQHRVDSKRAPKAPPLPKEAIATGPRELFVPRTQTLYDIVWNGQRGDFSLVGAEMEQPR